MVNAKIKVMKDLETYLKETTKEQVIEDWENLNTPDPDFSADEIFRKINFPMFEYQRTVLAFIIAGADKEVRSQNLELGLDHLVGIQNFLDYITDICCDMYGEEKVLPMMTKMLDEGTLGAKVIQHPASVDHKNKD